MTRILARFAIGLILSGIGMFLIAGNGWAIDGPQNLISTIGGFLNLYHLLFWCMIFGNLSTGTPLTDFFIQLTIPALHWVVLLAVLHAVWDHIPTFFKHPKFPKITSKSSRKTTSKKKK